MNDSNNFLDNFILATDSYKVTHHMQYPEHTEQVYSYFESRGGIFNSTVFFGLQYIIKKWLVGPVINERKIEQAKEIYFNHFGKKNFFNETGWRYISKELHGYLPLRIKAIPEGTVVPVKNILFSVENTDPQCYWLTNYIESLIVQVWYPITVATISREMKTIINFYLKETSEDLSGLDFMLHDFGFRAATCVEASAIGGAAHLVNFKGTDNISALMMAKQFYKESMAGFSIPASEHSTVTSWGESGELDAFENMLIKFPTGTISCVSDSYNIWRACEEYWGDKLKQQVENRKGVIVIRPDSGEPTKIVPEILNILGEKFGFTFNSKGFKLLPSCIHLIQGDGISVETIDGLCESICTSGWSLSNVTFGCGGGLIQKLNRDTQKCAFKCSYVEINKESRNVFKDPITDKGKVSKKGKLTLEKTENGYTTKQEGSGRSDLDCLKTVFENGILMKEYSLEEIRNNANHC